MVTLLTSPRSFTQQKTKMDAVQLLSDVLSELQSRNFTARKNRSGNIVVSNEPDDSIMIEFVGEEYTGVSGGTIEISYKGNDEVEMSIRANEATTAEIVNAISQL